MSAKSKIVNKIKIKKLVSMNPDKYQLFTFEYLWPKYRTYLKSCKNSVFEIRPKEFNDWCLTEI